MITSSCENEHGGQRLKKQEHEYFELRDNMIKEIPGTEFLKSPCLYLDRLILSLILTRIHLFEMIKEIPGSIVECGVYKGNSLALFQHLSSIYEPYNFKRRIIGFDTFEGFPSVSSKDSSIAKPGRLNDTNYEHIKKWTELHDKNRPIGHIPKVDLIKGDAIQTIPEYCKKNPHLIISLLYLDFDLYEPTKVALEHLLPLVPKGGIVAFDELHHDLWPGETEALKEKLEISKLPLKKFAYEPHVTYYKVN